MSGAAASVFSATTGRRVSSRNVSVEWYRGTPYATRRDNSTPASLKPPRQPEERQRRRLDREAGTIDVLIPKRGSMAASASLVAYGVPASTDGLVAPGGRDSQAVAITGQISGGDSTGHQDLAPVTLSFADRLLTVREVAGFLRVSTRTVYELCEKGRLQHVRIANAIRVEPTALVALVRSRTE